MRKKRRNYPKRPDWAAHHIAYHFFNRLTTEKKELPYAPELPPTHEEIEHIVEEIRFGIDQHALEPHAIPVEVMPEDYAHD